MYNLSTSVAELDGRPGSGAPRRHSKVPVSGNLTHQHRLLDGSWVRRDCSAFTKNQQNMMVVCKDQLDSIASKKRMGVEVAAAVESDITALLANKTYDQLSSLQRRVQEKLSSGEPIDTDYWEGLLKKLLVWKAKVSS